MAPVVAEYPPPDPFGDADPYAGGYEPTAGQLKVHLRVQKDVREKPNLVSSAV